MRVVIAPDKFKGSLSASEVIDALAAGIVRSVPDADIVGVPMADGGEGTLDAALAAGFQQRCVLVTGPDGERVFARYGRLGERALVELAEASGLALVAESRRDALHATSRGTGELIAHALADGATKITLAIGGSASTDGGAGMLAALGVRLLDSRGEPIGPGGAGLLDLHRVDLSALDSRVANANFLLASDVNNPLLGPNGAASVFAPQKGANPAEVELLDRGLQNWVRVLSGELGPDAVSAAGLAGAGAAGGVGYAALSVLASTSRGVQVRPGVEVVRELIGLDEHLVGADLVLTGEGSLDEQSLAGKTPVGVAQATKEVNPSVPVIAVCGRTALSESEARDAGFDAVFALTDSVRADSAWAESAPTNSAPTNSAWAETAPTNSVSAVEAMANPQPLLTDIGARIAQRYGRANPSILSATS